MSYVPTKAAMFCPHCGNTSIQTVIHTQSCDAMLTSPMGDDPSWHQAYYTVTRCETCSEILVYYAVDDFVEMTPTADHEFVAWGDLAYPSQPSLAEHLPVRLRSIYKEALLVKTRSPTAFVVLARRLLEGICQDRLGHCKNLAAGLDALVANGSIPPGLKEASTAVRLAGNLGAHASGRALNLLLANALDRLLSAIIEYLYVVPADVTEFRKLLDHFSRESTGE